MRNAESGNVVPSTTTMRGKASEWKNRPSGTAAMQQTRKQAAPSASATVLSWAIWRSLRSRSVTIVIPSPNSLTIVTTPRNTVAMPTSP